MTQIIHCANCGTANPSDARFCIDCGVALAPQATTGPTVKLQTRNCPWCKVANPLQAQLCVACGRSLDAQSQPVYAPPQPHYPPPQPRIYPRVQQSPMYAPQVRRGRGGWRGSAVHPGAFVAIAIAALVVMTLFNHRGGGGVPFFVFFLPLGLLSNALRGRSIRNYSPIFWVLGLCFLLGTGTLWPGILVLLVLWMLFGR